MHQRLTRPTYAASKLACARRWAQLVIATTTRCVRVSSLRWNASCSNNSDSPRRPKHASTSSTPPESRPEVAHQLRKITSTWACGRKPVIVHQGGATPLFCQPIRGDFNWWSIRVSQKIGRYALTRIALRKYLTDLHLRNFYLQRPCFPLYQD